MKCIFLDKKDLNILFEKVDRNILEDSSFYKIENGSSMISMCFYHFHEKEMKKIIKENEEIKKVDLLASDLQIKNIKLEVLEKEYSDGY